MALRLIPIDGGKAIKLDKPVLLFGRNPDCDVVLTESRKVSRTHCLVACVEHRVFVRDLASTNGVWINGHRVEREQRLRVGDELSVAEVRFELSNDEAPKGKAAPTEPPQKKRSAERPALQDENDMGLPRRSVKPIYIDPDNNKPVVLPEEDDSFVVEPSLARVAPVKPDRPKKKDASPPPEPPRKGDSKKPASQPKMKAKPPSSEILPVAEDAEADLLDLSSLLQEEEEELEDSGSDNRRRR